MKMAEALERMEAGLSEFSKEKLMEVMDCDLPGQIIRSGCA